MTAIGTPATMRKGKSPVGFAPLIQTATCSAMASALPVQCQDSVQCSRFSSGPTRAVLSAGCQCAGRLMRGKQDEKFLSSSPRYNHTCSHGGIAPRARGGGCQKRLAARPPDAPHPSRALAALRVGRRAGAGPPIRFRPRLGRARLCCAWREQFADQIHSTHSCRRDDPVTALTFPGMLLPFSAAKELLADGGVQTRGRASANKGRVAAFLPGRNGRARSQAWRCRVRVPLRSRRRYRDGV